MKHLGVFGLFLGLMGCTVIFSDEPNFFGDLEFTDPRCAQDRRCVLKNNFAYRDPFGVSWQAPAGVVTDGASIPQFLWDEIGRPFDEELVKAAVIHDFYCDNRVRSWQQTHRVFYDALITTGVPKERADVLYAGVLLGGPRWNLDGESSDFGYDPDEIQLDQGLPVEAPIIEEVDQEDVSEGEGVVVANGDEFVEEEEFSDREQETLDEDSQIEIDYQILVETIEQNPDLPPEAIANLVAQVEP